MLCYVMVWYGMAWYGIAWYGMALTGWWAWEVVLAGAGSMSGATAWGGRCGGQQAGASTMHRSIHPYNLPAKSSTVPPKEY